MEAKFGATLGKMACGIKVITNDGKKPSLIRAYLRNIIYLISTLLIFLVSFTVYLLPEFPSMTFRNFRELSEKSIFKLPNTIFSLVSIIDDITVVFNKKKRAIHDFIAQTYCVYK